MSGALYTATWPGGPDGYINDIVTISGPGVDVVLRTDSLALEDVTDALKAAYDAGAASADTGETSTGVGE